MASKVTLNDRGVITIPAQLRQAYGLKANDELILEDTEEGILLRPSISVPIEVYTEARIAEFAHDEEAIGKLLPPPSPRLRRASPPLPRLPPPLKLRWTGRRASKAQARKTPKPK